jgi:SAM-dependent methyltransferase
MMEEFDEDYFERGIETGKSLYTNYRWMPELTMSMAMTYIDYLGIQRDERILDFGCAKGFTVKALRLLHRQAWGCDISEYAVGCVEQDTKPYVRWCDDRIVPFDSPFNWIIVKDVMEHFEAYRLPFVLDELRKKCCGKMFVIVPLGKDNQFVVPAYNLDKTHKLAKDYYWWAEMLSRGWYLESFEYIIPGIKDNWDSYPKGNGFFVLRSLQ